MALKAAVGQGSALDGREASALAVRQALNALGQDPVALALIVASDEYAIQSVLTGVAPLLGDTPLIGFSSSHEMTNAGVHRRSVVVALLAGEGLRSQAAWWPGYAEDSRATVAQMLGTFGALDRDPQATLLLVLDGLAGDFAQFAAGLPGGPYAVGGCLSGGSVQSGRTFQIGGTQAGAGGLAAALVSGAVKAGVGTGHGWQRVGPFFRVTRSDGLWVRDLDGQPAAESYARLFGRAAREWAFPPLNELVRLYPLGVEPSGANGELVLRAPLRVEADGSLRMNAPVREGSTCHLMIGSPEACLKAARQAARQALAALGGGRPVLGVVLADVAWHGLLEGTPSLPLQVLEDELGGQVPLVGGFTFGQISRGSSATPELLNQHIEVILFGEQE